MFSAHVVNRIQLNRTFQSELKALNKLNQQKQELLGQLHKDLASVDPSVAAHVLALKQKAVDYQYDNLLTVEQEQNQLQDFYVNFLNTMMVFYPDQGLTAQTLLILEVNLKDQRTVTISSLSNLL
jgi:hypothetical protein